MKIFICTICKIEFKVYGARQAKFCSIACKAEYQKRYNRGSNHPRWQEGPREKVCKYCNQTFRWNKKQAYSEFKKQRFCKKDPCADKGGLRYYGKDSPRHNPDKEFRARRRPSWSKAVFERDDYTCQDCKKRGGDLHAHHIKSWKGFPELRYEISNGITLCVPCHYKTYSLYRKVDELLGTPNVKSRAISSQAQRTANM